MAREKVYTRAGDDGTTGLLFGGRVGKDSQLPRAHGGAKSRAPRDCRRADAIAGRPVPQPLVGFVVDIGAVGVPVTSDGALPKGVSLSRQTLETLKFTGKVGETYVIAQDKGAALILVGVGELSKLKVASLRKAAASLARVAAHGTHEGAGRWS